MTDTLNLTVGKATSKRLIPVADNVLCKCISIKPNRYNPDTMLDFGFLIIDFDYDEMDDDTNDVIQELAAAEYTHWERANILYDDDGNLKKSGKLYKMLKSMNNGKDYEEGDNINLHAHEGKNFRIDFEQEPAKGGPPEFTPIPGEFRNTLPKIRPEKRRKPARNDDGTIDFSKLEPVKPARKQAPVQAELDDADSDLYTEEEI